MARAVTISAPWSPPTWQSWSASPGRGGSSSEVEEEEEEEEEEAPPSAHLLTPPPSSQGWLILPLTRPGLGTLRELLPGEAQAVHSAMGSSEKVNFCPGLRLSKNYH